MLSSLRNLAFVLAVLGLTSTAGAADLNWTGLYRVEGVKVQNPELSSANKNKAYILHHLILSPKIVAADGVTIYSKFDIFNNSDFGTDSQAGETLGTSGKRSPRTSNGSAANVSSDRQNSGMIAVNELSASWVHEYGQLVVGRAPLHFGLGTTYNAGKGAFDHYFSNEDLVGYKFVIGNAFMMPMIGKVSEGDLGDEDDVNDYMFHLQYDNPETDLSAGFFYSMRIATQTGNDAAGSYPADSANANCATCKTGGYKTQYVGLFTSQKFKEFSWALEADLLSGSTGILNSASREVGINSYGIATEFGYHGEDSKWKWLMRAGIVSGDDPGSTDNYEGYIFNRNYDVAMLLFNHPMGNNGVDFMRTGLMRKTSATTENSQYTDTEAISNTIYFSPHFDYRWNDTLSLGSSFTYAMLNKDPVAGGSTDRSLGWEWDWSLTYKPYERLTWVNELGFLVPGEGWKAGNRAYENRVSYGFITKAAISF